MRISIGIPTLNGPDRLHRCLTSILEAGPLPPETQVLVVDDASTEANLKLNKDAIHRTREAGLPVELLMHAERSGIARGWNTLVRHAAQDVCVLLNDDIEVVPDWLDVLVYSVTANPELGMVGLNSYSGMTKAQTLWDFTHGPPKILPSLPDYRESPLLLGGGGLLASGGSIFAFSREHFDLVGGFDERYFCFYEEVDFGVSLRKAGLFHAIADYPRVFHMGGATTTSLPAQQYMLESRAKFIEKWNATPSEVRRQLDAAAGYPVCVMPYPKQWNSQLKFLAE